jgi:hypothetical protein
MVLLFDSHTIESLHSVVDCLLSVFLRLVWELPHIQFPVRPFLQLLEAIVVSGVPGVLVHELLAVDEGSTKHFARQCRGRRSNGEYVQ